MRIHLLICLLFVLVTITGCQKPEFAKANGLEVSDATGGSSHPNIILILADDVGYEIPTYTGGQSYSTPNIDYMAAHGLQFTKAHTAPLCSPSRFMLMTAKYNFRNYTTWEVMDTSQRTIANLLKTKGYTTCAAGKWQFDGGDASIHAFGFDRYLVTDPYKTTVEENGGRVRVFKDPQVYENGNFWPDAEAKGKYGEDLIRDYMFNFIDSVTKAPNKKPFFVYWATNLVHDPFGPTPDDPEFSTWNPNKKEEPGDTVYFSSMIKYHDKLIGQLLSKLQTDNIDDKTVILWLGDNGTSADIYSVWNGQVVRGGKSDAKESGTHVPMLAYAPGHIKPGTDTSLISLVDFMSTIGDMAKATIPSSYGTTDGISFYRQLLGDYSNVRPWIFCHFTGAGKVETNPLFLRRWMQDNTYKQYDSLTNANYSKKFFDLISDPSESHPIPANQMTAKEKTISNQFLQNMKQLH